MKEKKKKKFKLGESIAGYYSSKTYLLTSWNGIKFQNFIFIISKWEWADWVKK